MAAKKELKVDSESLTADASSESVDAVIGSALEEAGSENPSRKQSSIRTCTSTLAQLIRSDMVEELPRIKNLLSEKQDALSNYMDEISVASLKVSLEACRGLLHSERLELDLVELFPPWFNFRDSYFNEHPRVLAGVVTKELLKDLARYKASDNNRPDEFSILSQGFIAYMAARLFGQGSRNVN
ncbi:hypothetical protein BGZ97_010322, partial [Linnemannia gamsii]